MIIKKEVKNIEEITIDTFKLKNLEQLILNQKENCCIGSYLFNIFETNNTTYFLNLQFDKREVQQEKSEEPKLNILQSQFSFNQKKQESTSIKYEGTVEATCVIFRDNEFIEFKDNSRSVENLNELICQLDNKKCFEDKIIQKLQLNYRHAHEDEYTDSIVRIIERIFKGELIEYTLEEIFENRHKTEIFNISKIPIIIEDDTEEQETKYHIVYELRNQHLISKEEIDKITIQSLEKSTSKFLRIDNLDLFKEFFRLEKIT